MRAAVFCLASVIVLAIDLATWTVAYVVTNWWHPDAGRQPADWWVGFVLGMVATWLLYGDLKRRLGWPE